MELIGQIPLHQLIILESVKPNVQSTSLQEIPIIYVSLIVGLIIGVKLQVENA